MSLAENWDEPLPPDEREALIGRIIDFIARRGLQTPALIALEMHRPLGFVAAHAIMVGTPLVAPLLGLERLQGFARLIREPGAIDELIARIEASASAREAGSAAGKG